MSVQNGERLATKQDLADMYQEILPYLGMYPEGDIVYNVDLDLLQELEEKPQDEINDDAIPEDYEDVEPLSE